MFKVNTVINRRRTLATSQSCREGLGSRVSQAARDPAARTENMPPRRVDLHIAFMCALRHGIHPSIHPHTLGKLPNSRPAAFTGSPLHQAIRARQTPGIVTSDTLQGLILWGWTSCLSSSGCVEPRGGWRVTWAELWDLGSTGEGH